MADWNKKKYEHNKYMLMLGAASISISVYMFVAYFMHKGLIWDPVLFFAAVFLLFGLTKQGVAHLHNK